MGKWAKIIIQEQQGEIANYDTKKCEARQSHGDKKFRHRRRWSGSCTGFSLNVLFPRYSHIFIHSHNHVYHFALIVVFCFASALRFISLGFVSFALLLFW